MSKNSVEYEMMDGTTRFTPQDGQPILFQCPVCDRSHTRGFVNGVDQFRCLHCGYTGYGFHPDPDIDREVFKLWETNNSWNREHGIREIPQGVDPLNGPG